MTCAIYKLLLVAGCWLLVAGCWVTGNWKQFEFQSINKGRRSLNPILQKFGTFPPSHF